MLQRSYWFYRCSAAADYRKLIRRNRDLDTTISVHEPSNATRWAAKTKHTITYSLTRFIVIFACCGCLFIYFELDARTKFGFSRVWMRTTGQNKNTLSGWLPNTEFLVNISNWRSSWLFFSCRSVRHFKPLWFFFPRSTWVFNHRRKYGWNNVIRFTPCRMHGDIGWYAWCVMHTHTHATTNCAAYSKFKFTWDVWLVASWRSIIKLYYITSTTTLEPTYRMKFIHMRECGAYFFFKLFFLIRNVFLSSMALGTRHSALGRF